MPTRRHPLRLLVALLTIGALAAACGGGDREGGSAETTVPGTEPAVARESSDVGITEDAVTIGVISGDIEKLVQIGFASDIGDVRSMYETYLVNANAGGGINGRRIDWVFEEFDLVGGADSMRDACERLFAAADPFVVLTSSGFVDEMPCVTEDHDTPVIAMETFADTAYSDAGGNLFSIPASSQVSVTAMVELIAAQGALEGKTLGVLYGDRPGMEETVETALEPALERAGLTLTAKAQVLGMSSDPSTFVQFADTIEALKGAGVDGLFLLHDSFLSTNFLTQASKAGFTPDVYASDYQHISDPTVVPFIENYQAQAEFDGMLGVTYTRTGLDTSGVRPDPLDQGCVSRYEAVRGPNVPEYGTQRWAHMAMICQQIDLMLRGIRDAGPNPTQEGFRDAITALPSMHLGYGGNGSFAPGKQDGADEFRVVRYDAATNTFVEVAPYAAAGR